MSFQFSFARVPFNQDGDWHKFIRPDDEDDELIEGVERFKWDDQGNDCLSLGGIGFGVANQVTNGLFREFLEGGPLTWDSNGRYILLKPRAELFARLKEQLLAAKGYVWDDIWRELILKIDEMYRLRPNENIALVIT